MSDQWDGTSPDYNSPAPPPVAPEPAPLSQPETPGAPAWGDLAFASPPAQSPTPPADPAHPAHPAPEVQPHPEPPRLSMFHPPAPQPGFNAPITLTGAPAPTIRPPMPETPQTTWSTPLPQGPPAPSMGLRWNWAAGTVVGLAALAATMAVPSFFVMMDNDLLSDAPLEEWLLYASAAVGLIAVVALGSRLRPLVSALALIGAGCLIASAVLYTDQWDFGLGAAWSSAMTIASAAVLGLCGGVMLRRE